MSECPHGLGVGCSRAEQCLTDRPRSCDPYTFTLERRVASLQAEVTGLKATIDLMRIGESNQECVRKGLEAEIACLRDENLARIAHEGNLVGKLVIANEEVTLLTEALAAALRLLRQWTNLCVQRTEGGGRFATCDECNQKKCSVHQALAAHAARKENR